MSSENYLKLQSKFDAIVPREYKNNITWNKWKNFGGLNAIFHSDIDFKILITLINIKQFLDKCDNQQNGSYIFIKKLKDKIYDQDIVEQVDKKGVNIREKLTTKSEALYFLNFWEKFCIQSLKENIHTSILNDTSYHLTFHSPQMCSRDEHKAIIEEVGLEKQNVSYMTGDSHIGIGLSDIVAGCMRDLLGNNEGTSAMASSLYGEKIKPRLMDVKIGKNPGAVHYSGIPFEEQNRINLLLF